MAADFDSNRQADDLENDPQTDVSEDDELEQYGIWVKVGPEDIEHGGSEDDFGLESLSNEEIDSEILLTEEEENLLGSLEDGTTEGEAPVEETPVDLSDDLQMDDDLGELSDLALDDFDDGTTAETGGAEIEETELSAEEELGNLSDLELEDEVPEIGLDGDLIEIEPDLQIPVAAGDDESPLELDIPEEASPGADEAFDDLDIEDLSADLELDSLEASLETANTPEEAAEEVSFVSIEKPDLEKIESELKSIKAELENLKSELSLLKQTSRQPEETEQDGAGFLSEDEDETIALTGDELDNILNTADITEETVEETEAPEDQDFIDFPVEGADGEEETAGAAADLLVDREDIISLDESAEADIEDLDIEEPEADVADEMETIDLDESDELLGEILPAEEELLEEEAPSEAEPFDLDLEPIELEEETGEAVPELEELDIEDVEMSAEPMAGPDLELEEILDEEAGETEAEELELDIDSDIAELSDTEEEIEELTVEVDEELDDVDLVELEGSEEEPALFEEAPELEPHETKASKEDIPDKLKHELRSVLSYMDHLLESLPEEKIQEFAQSEHFETYKKLFEELGLEQ
ncbi:MAG: hypothetical protein JW852_10000 [Spirochaetales bacterium]|nr:hypothetical protein [Spirochaetales bacterium]